MEWWYFGPVLLAIVLFLLVGTVFERRIEMAWQQFMERRRAQIAVMAAQGQSLTQIDRPPATATCNATATNATPRLTPVCNTYNSPPTPSPCNAEPTPPATEISALNLGTEVPASTVYGKSEGSAVKTPSKKSLRSRKSSTLINRQSVVVVKS